MPDPDLMKRQVAEAADLITRATEVPVQALGLDLDGTIDEAPHFFGVLSRIWPGKVYVITYRDDLAKAERDVAGFGVRCDGVILVDSFAGKADVIRRLGIGVYFDDMDEVLTHVPEDVTVLKVRNGGNFEGGRWLYSDKTGRQV